MKMIGGGMHTLTIYLLKEGSQPAQSMKKGMKPTSLTDPGVELPERVLLFEHRRKSNIQWWIDYLGLSDQDRQNQLEGALLFVPIDNRWLCVTFGSGYWNLLDNHYEYDFGLICCLNSIDPDKLKSIDSVQPASAKRSRVQVPKDSELDVFGLLGNESLLNSASGNVLPKYEAYFKTITGSAPVRIQTDCSAIDLAELCRVLVNLYESREYLKRFPSLRDISPIKDPARKAELDDKLLAKFRDRDAGFVLSVPSIVDYGQFSGVAFTEKSTYCMPLTIDSLWKELGAKGKTASIGDLKNKWKMRLVDDNNEVRFGPYSLYKCLSWECEEEGCSYQFCDGMWFQVKKDYLDQLNAEVHELFEQSSFPDKAANQDEGAYNEFVAKGDSGFVLLDRRMVTIEGYGKFEACDLYREAGCRAELVHVKCGTDSARLSHLFNQGGNSAEILISSQAARNDFKVMMPEGRYTNSCLARIEEKQFKILFVILTQKDITQKESNLPFFSRVSLRYTARRLRAMGVGLAVQYARDIR